MLNKYLVLTNNYWLTLVTKNAYASGSFFHIKIYAQTDILIKAKCILFELTVRNWKEMQNTLLLVSWYPSTAVAKCGSSKKIYRKSLWSQEVYIRVSVTALFKILICNQSFKCLLNHIVSPSKVGRTDFNSFVEGGVIEDLFGRGLNEEGMVDF